MTDLENNKIENPQNSAEELADNGTNDQVDQNNTDERNEEVSSEQVENSTEEKVTDSDHTENSEEPKQDPVEEKPSEAVANKTPEEPEKQEVEEVSKKTESEDDEDAPFEEENQEQDYSVFSKGELIAKLQQLLDENEVFELKDDVDIIKSSFYRLHRAENEAKRREFVENGGEQVDFKPEKDPQEEEFKSILGKYKEKKSAYIQKLEKQKEDNLRKKYEVIEGIKELINGQESLNKTFEEFRKLQDVWKEIGLVPQNEVKNLWETYHHHVEKFYDYVNINRELRDLDLKKNLETKIEICEKAEELLLETNIKKAFNELQVLHDQFREVGPVPKESKDDIWNRFKEATTKINKRHQEYFLSLKEEQKNNLQAKTLICEKLEEINTNSYVNHKDWKAVTDEVLGLQQMWKTIGFAPKKYNNTIYERFRVACDEFFNRKKEFYGAVKEEQNNNLQLKTELCIQAEALKDSTDWKNTTRELINLQKEWKKIGPVPRKKSDVTWKRFRSACDEFFNNKEEHFKTLGSKQEENLKQKEILLTELESFKTGDDAKSDLNALKSFQKRWAEIGHVPIEKKNTIQDKYRELINSKFDNLNISKEEKNIVQFKARVETFSKGGGSRTKINEEREKIVQKMRKLENDITVWENNIGFFNNSKNAESLIKDVEKKIDKAKTELMQLKDQIKMLDKIEN